MKKVSQKKKEIKKKNEEKKEQNNDNKKNEDKFEKCKKFICNNEIYTEEDLLLIKNLYNEN